MKKNLLLAHFFLFFSILSLGCATTHQSQLAIGKTVSPDSGVFNRSTGIYENKQMGFRIWFPAGYEIYSDKTTLTQYGEQYKWDSVPIFFGANERDSIWVLMFGEMTPMKLDDYVYLLKARFTSDHHIISSKEKTLGGMQYVEIIFLVTVKEPPYQGVEMIYHGFVIDMEEHKGNLVIFTLKKSYNQRKEDQISEIMATLEKVKTR